MSDNWQYTSEDGTVAQRHLSPFQCVTKTKTQDRLEKFIVVPERYLELFVDDLEVEYFTADDPNGYLPFTEDTYTRMHLLYVASFWMETWYVKEAPTPACFMYNYPPSTADLVELQAVFERYPNDGMFVRLNSLSPKVMTPFFSINAAIDAVNASERCQNILNLTACYDLPQPLIVLRPFMDLTKGSEFRCFVYKDKLRAICSNDELETILTTAEVEVRCEALVKTMTANQWTPFQDCVLDVWLPHDRCRSAEDMVIEINSWGVWSNADAGLFCWMEDAAVLNGLIDRVSVRLLD